MRFLKFIMLAAIVWTFAMLAFVVGLVLLGYVGLLAVGFGLAAWAGHTLASQAVCDDVLLALRRIGMSDKAAAIEQGITAQQWTNQKAGDEMMSLYRLAELPVEFWLEFSQLRIERFAGGLVMTSQDLIALVKSNLALIERLDRSESSTAADRKVA